MKIKRANSTGQYSINRLRPPKRRESSNSQFSYSSGFSGSESGSGQNLESPRRKNQKRMRKRKTKEQIKMLENEFIKNPHWSNDDVVRIAEYTKLEKSQVYKWNWDKKKK